MIFQHPTSGDEQSRDRKPSIGSVFSSFFPGEDTPLIPETTVEDSKKTSNEKMMWSHCWLPGSLEDDDEPTRTILWKPSSRGQSKQRYSHRSLRRRIFLLLTEPATSYVSAIFFTILIIAITASNVIMILQTMQAYQFTPSDCVSCGGNHFYVFEDDDFSIKPGVPCVCPPAPNTAIVKAEDYIVYFFTVEWSLRVLFFEPPPSECSPTFGGFACQWLSFLTETTTILDALAIFPYYAERFEKTNGLMSLRLLRLFRVFQLVRLGQYNSTFLSVTHVLYQSMLYLKLLMVVLLFGATFFGSMLYWIEKGDWKYYDGTYMFVRQSVDGYREEPSPFTSIPVACWYFLVTATTVGYGDIYPTTTAGRCIAAIAMLTGVLVIAFPVSVFSDLWSQELRSRGVEPIDSKDNNIDGGRSSGRVEMSLSPPTSQWNGTILSRGIPEEENPMTFAADDLAAIAKHMQDMEKSQERIRRILHKYDIDT